MAQEADRESLETIVTLARAGDTRAYGALVRQFEGMARSYALRYLHDFHLAQDVAQEAFLEAYQCLGNLREPLAFPAWFRRIVFKHCDRVTRGKRLAALPLDSMPEQRDSSPDPAQFLDLQHCHEKNLEKLRTLPPHERIVVTLFYLNGYSQNEISEFLKIPISTIKNRLRTARLRLETGRGIDARDERCSAESDERHSLRVISELLGCPKSLETRANPVRSVWEAVRAGLDHYEVVYGAEIEDRDDILGEDSGKPVDYVFHLSKDKVLRPNMLDIVAKAVRGRKPPVRSMAPGRVFQVAQSAPYWMSNEVDGILLEDRATLNTVRDPLDRILSLALGGKKTRWIEEQGPFFSHMAKQGPFLSHMTKAQARSGDDWITVCRTGTCDETLLRCLGQDPRKAVGCVFGIHLESIVKVRS